MSIQIDLSQLISAQAKQELIEAEKRIADIAAAHAYLDETDWYVARLAETGAPIPQDVSEKRAQSRDILSSEQ